MNYRSDSVCLLRKVFFCRQINYVTPYQKLCKAVSGFCASYFESGCSMAQFNKSLVQQHRSIPPRDVPYLHHVSLSKCTMRAVARLVMISRHPCLLGLSEASNLGIPRCDTDFRIKIWFHSRSTLFNARLNTDPRKYLIHFNTKGPFLQVVRCIPSTNTYLILENVALD